ncbi:hypothetical protein QVE09_22325 [Paenibacillus sp. ClWae2A]|uniref:DUF6199 family natural product biosynthesis protein n=1 Tax=Paenibacillus sp. ClWae2A TaxID=3057177 RepID=UPI0028F52238|nr:DUF6199 family natural product biosynthesis protein [Paenibacillus sp. ClWae2A]MDT9721643.1 hypothetical protein [Paenibacillus sp. ClWae2A]
MIVTIAIIFGLVGLLMLSAPSILWMITEKWKSSDTSEPSALYKLSVRVGGVACLGIAVYATYGLFL